MLQEYFNQAAFGKPLEPALAALRRHAVELASREAFMSNVQHGVGGLGHRGVGSSLPRFNTRMQKTSRHKLHFHQDHLQTVPQTPKTSVLYS